jgi:hypothetical protein
MEIRGDNTGFLKHTKRYIGGLCQEMGYLQFVPPKKRDQGTHKPASHTKAKATELPPLFFEVHS